MKPQRGNLIGLEADRMAVITVRTIIVFLCILAAMRLMGKRQLGQLELSELVVAVLISDLAAMPLQDLGIPLLNGLVPVVILFSCELLISWLSLKSPGFRRLCFGKPSILMRDGKILARELSKNRFSLDELCEELRGKGVTDLRTVSCAILETDGTLNVLLRAECQPPTASQLGVQTPEPGLPTALISDGQVETANLRLLGLSQSWLLQELKRRGYTAPEQVYYMNLDGAGGIYLQGKEPK